MIRKINQINRMILIINKEISLLFIYKIMSIIEQIIENDKKRLSQKMIAKFSKKLKRRIDFADPKTNKITVSLFLLVNRNLIKLINITEFSLIYSHVDEIFVNENKIDGTFNNKEKFQ